jgi:glycosyltransferase involved in cell wall biosynthesis
MMPAYNAEHYINHAVQSVLNQTYLHWELIIVDDGSTDGTRQVIDQFVDPRIKVVHQPNGGEACARNTALQHIQGEYLAFLDADDLYLSDHLRVAIEFLNSHPKFEGVYTDGYYCNEAGEILQTLSSRRRGPFEGDIFEEVVRSSDVFGVPVCVVLHRDLLLRYQLDFDPKIIIGPDWDFFSRYSEIAKFGYIPQFTCQYRIHRANITTRTGQQLRNTHLALCREKAIKLRRFKDCSSETRTFIFYDLLVNLLKGCPDRQAEITTWQEFQDLPIDQQARLYRLMASKEMIRDLESPHVGEWLRLSREKKPKDGKGFVLNFIYNIDPRLLRLILNIKSRIFLEAIPNSPFADIKQ